MQQLDLKFLGGQGQGKEMRAEIFKEKEKD
jgi:hypothetical protein